MKKIIMSLCFLSILGCQPKVENNEKTLNDIFNSDTYKVEVKTCGCFGCGTYSYKISLVDNQFKISNSDNQNEISVSNESIESFKKFMLNNIGKNITGFCTSIYEYKVFNKASAVTFTDESCEKWEILNKIILLKKIPNSLIE